MGSFIKGIDFLRHISTRNILPPIVLVEIHLRWLKHPFTLHNGVFLIIVLKISTFYYWIHLFEFLTFLTFLSSPSACWMSGASKNRDYSCKCSWFIYFGVTGGSLFWRIFWRIFLTIFFDKFFVKFFDKFFSTNFFGEFFWRFFWRIFWRIFLTKFLTRFFSKFFWQIVWPLIF